MLHAPQAGCRALTALTGTPRGRQSGTCAGLPTWPPHPGAASGSCQRHRQLRCCTHEANCSLTMQQTRSRRHGAQQHPWAAGGHQRGQQHLLSRRVLASPLHHAAPFCCWPLPQKKTSWPAAAAPGPAAWWWAGCRATRRVSRSTAAVRVQREKAGTASRGFNPLQAAKLRSQLACGSVPAQQHTCRWRPARSWSLLMRRSFAVSSAACREAASLEDLHASWVS
jgi:hypothetical protein